MKKYIPLLFFLLFWCVAALFEGPSALIPVAAAAVILWAVLQTKKRALWLGLAAVAAVGVCIYNVQFLLRCAPPLLLTLAHTEALLAGERSSQKRPVRPEGAYTGVILCAAVSLAALILDIAAAARLSAGIVSVRLYWAFAGVLLFAAAVLVFGRGGTGRERKKASSAERRISGAFVLIWACCCVCSAASAAGCLINGTAFSGYTAVFSWLLFLAAAAWQGDRLQAAAAARLSAAVQKLFSDPE